MIDLCFNRRLDQRPRFCRIVEVVAQRIGHGVRHHNLGRKMHDRIDAVALNDGFDQRFVADIAFDQRHEGGNKACKTGRQIIEHHEVFADLQQIKHHMAANIAGTAGHENGHMAFL